MRLYVAQQFSEVKGRKLRAVFGRRVCFFPGSGFERNVVERTDDGRTEGTFCRCFALRLDSAVSESHQVTPASLYSR